MPCQRPGGRCSSVAESQNAYESRDDADVQTANRNDSGDEATAKYMVLVFWDLTSDLRSRG